MPDTLNRATNPGVAYDAAGNMTSDGLHSYTYDAEGMRVATFTGRVLHISCLRWGITKVPAGLTGRPIHQPRRFPGLRIETWGTRRAGGRKGSLAPKLEFALKYVRSIKEEASQVSESRLGAPGTRLKRQLGAMPLL